MLYMGTTPNVDLAGVELVEELRETFEARGIAFRVAEARGNARDALQRAGFDDREAPPPAHQTDMQVIESWRAGKHPGARAG